MAGAVLSVTHGVQELVRPEPATDFIVGYVVLAVSFVLEGVSFLRSVRQAKPGAQLMERDVIEQVKVCFGHRAQVLALRRMCRLLSDSPRKSMEAMLARVTEPGSYQAFQHFITDAPWNADAVWRRLRTVIPEREGLLIFDGTSFPKQGTHWVGVASQSCGALGKIANCQVAVTAALWTGARAYLLGAALYVPAEWLTAAARTQARFPSRSAFKKNGAKRSGCCARSGRADSR